MTFYSYRKKSRNWQKPVIVLVVILGLLLIGNFLAQKFFPAAASVASPFGKVADEAGSGWLNFFAFFRTKEDLLRENEKLARENFDLKLALVNRRGLEKENRELKRLLDLSNQESKKSIVAKVLLTPNVIASGVVTLDVGRKNSEIKPGDLVVYNDKVLLGRVLEVRDYHTKVGLVSTNKAISVLIGKENLPAEATGLGGGNFSITLPKGAEVVKGDVVIAPEYGGYLLGLVDVIKKTNADPFQTILFNAPINIFQIKWVEVYAV
jgi:rod shape-determining protein MreC